MRKTKIISNDDIENPACAMNGETHQQVNHGGNQTNATRSTNDETAFVVLWSHSLNGKISEKDIMIGITDGKRCRGRPPMRYDYNNDRTDAGRSYQTSAKPTHF